MSTKVLTDLDLDNNDLLNVGSGGGGGVATEDEGVSVDPAATTLNFVGAGVTATDAGSNVTTVTIPGGTSGVATQDEGISVDPAATTLNFVGAGVTATDAGSNVTTVTIPGGGGSSPLTTKGDIYTYDTGDARLPVGADGQILSANSATATGLEWIVNTGGGGSSEGARIQLNTTQSIPNSTPTIITFDTEVYDDASYIDIGGNPTRITIAEEGTYAFDLFSNFDFSALGSFRQVRLKKNGSVDLAPDRLAIPGSNNVLHHTAYIIKLDASDYLEVEVFQNSGGNLNYSSVSTGLQSYVAIQRLTGSGGGGSGRTQQATSVTYYVRTTGNDSNDGLSTGTALLTIQAAIDLVTALDLLPGVLVTIDVGAGTFAGFTTKSIVGQGEISIQGAGSASTTINSAGIFDHLGKYYFGGITWDGGGTLNIVDIRSGVVEMNAECDFLSANVHILVSSNGATLLNNSDYSISGGAVIHVAIQENGLYKGSGSPIKTVTLNGTPAFSDSFIRCLMGGVADNNPTRTSYSGAATGPRYRADANGVVYAPTGGASYYPGNSAGVTANGGVYVG